MTRSLVAAGAINGGIAVAAGAFAAHGLKDRLEPRAFEVFETAARYQMYHALAMLLCGVLVLDAAKTCGWLFQAGIVLFSGSLYALSLSGMRAFGAIAPFGGLAFLVAWLVLALAALRGL